MIIIAVALWGLSPWPLSEPAYPELIPVMKAIPGGLPTDVRERLSKRQQELEKDRKDFLAAAERFNAKPAEEQSDAEYASLQASRTRYISSVRAFNQEVDKAAKAVKKKLALTARMEALNKQIKDTEIQLQGLGFKQRTEDFEQIGKISSDAAARLKAKLFLRLQELVTDKAEEVMQERFLKMIKDLKPDQVKNMLAAMEQAGVSDPYFLEWLRSFKPDKKRGELVADAKVVINFVKKAQDLGKFFEELQPGTVDANQEAALTLVSLVIDHPYLTVLKPVAAGTYDVGEAWFFIAVLDMNEKDLAAVTDSQLSAQKILIKRMENLVQERNKTREELKKFTK